MICGDTKWGLQQTAGNEISGFCKLASALMDLLILYVSGDNLEINLPKPIKGPSKKVNSSFS